MAPLPEMVRSELPRKPASSLSRAAQNVFLGTYPVRVVCGKILRERSTHALFQPRHVVAMFRYTGATRLEWNRNFGPRSFARCLTSNNFSR